MVSCGSRASQQEVWTPRASLISDVEMNVPQRVRYNKHAVFNQQHVWWRMFRFDDYCHFTTIIGFKFCIM